MLMKKKQHANMNFKYFLGTRRCWDY